MRLTDAVQMALGTLRSHAGRTLLTILGLGVGVAAVLTVLALGAAGEAQVEVEIGRMGVNCVWVSRADGGCLTEADVENAAGAAGTSACAGAARAGVVVLDGEAAAAQLTAYDASMQAVHDVQLIRGRGLSAADHDGRNPVCLLDAALAAELGGDVLGRRLLLGGRLMTIVGVAQTLPASAISTGGVVAMPLGTYEDTFGETARELTLKVPADGDAALLAEAVRAALGGDFRTRTLQQEISAARSIVRIFVTVLMCVAGVCMATGGVGVMNVLLLSVRERQREIGLLKALGATAGQVCLLFLLEAVGYAALGGVSGLALGAGLIALCGAWTGVPAALTWRQAAPVMLLAAALGLLFGVIPALRAARLQVVDALRQH
ncbi:MAG: ABC transporter permease [Clostridia bacterium]|nr:ABC transporter permease [Clostridia bacterium]